MLFVSSMAAYSQSRSRQITLPVSAACGDYSSNIAALSWRTGSGVRGGIASRLFLCGRLWLGRGRWKVATLGDVRVAGERCLVDLRVRGGGVVVCEGVREEGMGVLIVVMMLRGDGEREILGRRGWFWVDG